MPLVNIFMTGNYKKLNSDIIDNKPENVYFTGYLSDDDYWEILCSVNLIIDLTHRDNCLVCGAYEAAAIGKPMILSDTTALRKYFRKGYVFTKNNPDDIVKSVNYAMDNIEELTRLITDFKGEIDADWEGYSQSLSNILRDFQMGNRPKMVC
jgi:glycosyltransferase involved in cell wall biosynthesis